MIVLLYDYLFTLSWGSGWSPTPNRKGMYRLPLSTQLLPA